MPTCVSSFCTIDDIMAAAPSLVILDTPAGAGCTGVAGAGAASAAMAGAGKPAQARAPRAIAARAARMGVRWFI